MNLPRGFASTVAQTDPMSDCDNFLVNFEFAWYAINATKVVRVPATTILVPQKGDIARLDSPLFNLFNASDAELAIVAVGTFPKMKNPEEIEYPARKDPWNPDWNNMEIVACSSPWFFLV